MRINFTKYFMTSVTIASLVAIISCKEESQSSNHDNQVQPISKEEAQEVNVYSARLPELIEPIFESFTKETGIKVNFIFLKQGILERLKSEGEFTPADVVLLSDIGSIYDITKENLAQPIKSKLVGENIPQQYRNKDNLWVGLTGRIRMLARNPNLGIPVKGYDILASKEMKKRVCSRSFSHPYNVSLVATYIEQYGEQQTQEWLGGWKDNLFDTASGDDTGQIKLIANGLCDVAPVNHYYYAQMINLDKNLSSKVELVPLSEMEQGAYMNISGALMAKYSQNVDEANKLIEFMTSQKAQELFAKLDYEIPLNPKVLQQSKFFDKNLSNIAPISLDAIAGNREKALKLIYSLEK